MTDTPWNERERLYQKRWDSLSPSAQLPNQLAGRTAVGCGATHHVMERCDFACTCCYLGPVLRMRWNWCALSKTPAMARQWMWGVIGEVVAEGINCEDDTSPAVANS